MGRIRRNYLERIMLTNLASMALSSSSTQAPRPPPFRSPLPPPGLQLLLNLPSILLSARPSLLLARTSNKKWTISATPAAILSPRRRREQRVAHRIRSRPPRWRSRRHRPSRPLGEPRQARGARRLKQEGTASCRRSRVGRRRGLAMLSRQSCTKVKLVASAQRRRSR